MDQTGKFSNWCAYTEMDSESPTDWHIKYTVEVTENSTAAATCSKSPMEYFPYSAGGFLKWGYLNKDGLQLEILRK